MKHKLLLCLALVLSGVALPAMAQAQFKWTTNNGNITITNYTGSGGAVDIPGTITGLPVTSIGVGAFRACTSLTCVTIPNSVTNIGHYAFTDCRRLANVTIGNNVSSIGNLAFYACTSLTNVAIPNSVLSITYEAFGESGLTRVAIPNSVTSIAGSAFAGCSKLAAITVATDNPAYSGFAGVLFNKNQTILIEYPAGRVGKFMMTNRVNSIGDQAFLECGSLTGVTIPNSVTNIGDHAFAACGSLTNVTIPGSVTTIGYCVFLRSTNLSNFVFPRTATNIKSQVPPPIPSD